MERNAGQVALQAALQAGQPGGAFPGHVGARPGAALSRPHPALTGFCGMARRPQWNGFQPDLVLSRAGPEQTGSPAKQ